jgi:hypothetical protein
MSSDLKIYSMIRFDEKAIAAICEDNVIQLWNFEKGRMFKKLENKEKVNCICNQLFIL